jgi:hypothetical protein|tara:strand:- start:239 stop:496 length:258 start_codon:yes stop_codon:yes gene_type:complete
MKYTVNYGVDNSHINEIAIFKLYRDAVKFYNLLPKDKYPAKIIYKLFYNANGYVIDKQAKNYEFVGGGINESLLLGYIIKPLETT